MPVYAIVKMGEGKPLGIVSCDGEHHTFFASPGLAQEVIEESARNDYAVAAFSLSALAANRKLNAVLVVRIDGVGRQTKLDRKTALAYKRKYGD